MKRFIEGAARDQGGLFPAHLDDFIGEDNPVRAVDAFVDMLDLRGLGFAGVDPCATGRPGYHPAVLLKLYIYGYLNRVASSRRLDLILAHEVSNVGSDRGFLSSMGKAARKASVCTDITVLAVRGYYSRDEVRACEGTGIEPYIPKSETSGGYKRGRFTSQDFRYDAKHDHYICPAGRSLTQSSTRSRQGRDIETIHYRNLTACGDCLLKPRCTSETYKRLKSWKHEKVLDDMQDRLEQMPDAMKIRRQTVEHPFGTLKAWMGATHFLTKTLKNVKTEMSLQVLAYNLKRMIKIFGVGSLIRAMDA